MSINIDELKKKKYITYLVVPATLKKEEISTYVTQTAVASELYKNCTEDSCEVENSKENKAVTESPKEDEIEEVKTNTVISTESASEPAVLSTTTTTKTSRKKATATVA